MENKVSVYNRAIRQIRTFLIDGGYDIGTKEKEMVRFFAKVKYNVVLTDRKACTDWLISRAIGVEFNGWPFISKKAKERKLERKTINKNYIKNGIPVNKRNYIPYGKFLKTSYWLKVRKIILQRDNHKCVKCGGVFSLQVHHLNYDHHLNEMEHLDDLVTLCKKCHKKEHKGEKNKHNPENLD